MVDQEPLFDLGRGRRVKSRGPSFWLPLAERVRTAKGYRQAVVKVTGFGRGARGVGKAMDYISRQGKLPLEKDTGELIQGLEEQRELIREWSIDFDAKRNSRDSAQIVFSMPLGSPVEALRKAVRETGARAFPDNEWVFAIHEDRKHPHAHMVVKMRGIEHGQKLKLKKADLFELRGIFAEAAREQGVELAASPRWARGIGHKGIRQEVYYQRKRQIALNIDKQNLKEAKEELIKADWAEKPWEKKMRERNKQEREVYQQEADRVRKAAKRYEGRKEQDQLHEIADSLERFARNMPVPKTRKRALKERALERHYEREREEAREKDRGAELER